MPPSGFGATPGITPTMLNIRPRTPVPRGNIVNPTLMEPRALLPPHPTFAPEALPA